MRIPHEDEGRDQGNEAETKEHQRLPANYQKVQERRETCSPS